MSTAMGPLPLEPLHVLFDAAPSHKGYCAVALPPTLAALYGPLALPEPREGLPYVFANFVSTLDGVVALDAAGASGGGEISGFNSHDRMVMGVLRALANAVVVGAGTLRADREHIWTPSHIYPPLAPAYQALRAASGGTEASRQPLTVIVTRSGALDLSLPVFQSGETHVLIVTSEHGGRSIEEKGNLPEWVSVGAVPPSGLDSAGRITARAILDAIAHSQPAGRILVEGGPHLLADFLAAGCLDELFLTLAPQLAGRDTGKGRLALIEGRAFAPEHPVWTTLVSARRAGSHLFLRYALPPTQR